MYAGQGGQLLVAEGLVCLQARGGDAEQVVGVAEKPFGVPDLGDFREAVFEFGDGGGVFAVHGDLHQDFEAEPDRVGHLNLKAATLGRLGDFEQALELYRQVLERAPNQPRVLMSYGHMLKTVGRLE